MAQIKGISRFIAAASDRGSSQSAATHRGRPPFITISRQFGAGGRTLAEGIIEAFEKHRDEEVFRDWQIFDRALCEFVADDPNLNVKLRELLDESSLNAVEDVIATALGRSPQREVHRKVNETIRSLAVLGKSIIVGRGAASATRDLGTGFHIRLVAPESLRIERQAQVLGQGIDEVTRIVRERDRNRTDLVSRMTGEDIEDPLLYDVVWNTESTPNEVIVESIVAWVKHLRSAR